MKNCNIRKLCQILAAYVLLASSIGQCWTKATATATTTAGIENVLILLADDHGFEMGAYLNKFAQTPNLDALAKRGLLFNDAYTTASSCSPSRAQLLTGQVSHASGMYGLHQDVHNFNVLPAMESLPNLLRAHTKDQRRPVLTGLIGKKNVGPAANFVFDYEQSEAQHSINAVGRNISNIKAFAREFLAQAQRERRPFVLLVGFHDPHRCGHITPQFGEFCERYGSGEPDMGRIPDWTPIYYDWRNLEVPPSLPDTDVVRQELAAQYMTISRLDQGVGLVLRELQAHGFDNSTLVIYTSDNGPPFPGGRTNLYDYGARVPMIMAAPLGTGRQHQTTAAMTTLLDVFATTLDVFNASSSTPLGAKSLLPLLHAEPKPTAQDAIFGSQNYHEVTMAYPMRMVRTRRHKLIHNLNYWSLFPIDQDLYMSPTFQQILNATFAKQRLPWFRSLASLYERPEWELYDVVANPLESVNLFHDPKHQATLVALQRRLAEWQAATGDPWRCAPHGVLQDKGVFKEQPVCLTLGHEAVQRELDNYLEYSLL